MKIEEFQKQHRELMKDIEWEFATTDISFVTHETHPGFMKVYDELCRSCGRHNTGVILVNSGEQKIHYASGSEPLVLTTQLMNSQSPQQICERLLPSRRRLLSAAGTMAAFTALAPLAPRVNRALDLPGKNPDFGDEATVLLPAFVAGLVATLRRSTYLKDRETARHLGKAAARASIARAEREEHGEKPAFPERLLIPAAKDREQELGSYFRRLAKRAARARKADRGA